MTDTRYNGWTNYETWNAALWIDNEQSSSEYWAEQAQECYDEAEAGGLVNSFTREDNATADLREKLKSYFDDNMEEMGVPKLTGMYADLLNAALSEINWHEIAEHMIAEVDHEETATA